MTNNIDYENFWDMYQYDLIRSFHQIIVNLYDYEFRIRYNIFKINNDGNNNPLQLRYGFHSYKKPYFVITTIFGKINVSFDLEVKDFFKEFYYTNFDTVEFFLQEVSVILFYYFYDLLIEVFTIAYHYDNGSLSYE